jgi:hypothetical protein
MRPVFTSAILLIALIYTYHAFADMNFLSSTGRLGPAFFPRIIGGTLILACLYSLALEFGRGRGRSWSAEDGETGDWRATVSMVLASGLFVLLLDIIGGLLGMVTFLLSALFLLNRGRTGQNLAIGVLVPIGVYLLFDVWLDARMPEGILHLPL